MWLGFAFILNLFVHMHDAVAVPQFLREGEGEKVSFETGCPGSRGWSNFGLRWTRGVGGLEN